MMKKTVGIVLVAAMAIASVEVSYAQKGTKAKKTAATEQPAPAQRMNPTERQKAEITEVIDRIYNYLNSCTPFGLVDGDGNVLTDYSKIDRNTTMQKGDFGISTYEWGVTYSGMLLASEATGEGKYADYVYERLKFIGDIYPYIKDYYEQTGYDMKLKYIVSPRFLDDCGSMCAAMIKAVLARPETKGDYRDVIEDWFNFTMYKEYRFGNGILARNRPTTNSVWLDDMYMGITPIAFRAKLSQSERGDLTQKFYNEAINQVNLFKKYLWVPEKQMYRHGWIEGMSEHPDYHWARANGWAMLTMSDVLDVLPANMQGRDEVLSQLKTLIRTVASYQSGEGTWHQLLDRNDSYLETSASAMYVYCIAHAINQGWIDRTAYQDIARSGWNAIVKQVNEKGQVENTCVGTGLGFTPVFYYTRPVSVLAPHGYGPVLLAAAETLKMLDGNAAPAQQPAGFPGAPAQGQGAQARPAAPMPMFAAPGSSRVEGKPMVFLAGDSTCKNGRGTGDNGQWGWGSFFGEYLNDQVVVENDAMGGLSSRTFYNNSWSDILSAIQPGDYVLIQFGHNDEAPLNTGRARGTIDGTSDEKQTVIMEKNGAPEDVYSYGHYIRMYVRQAKMRGATPIVLSPTPQNRWTGENSISRFDNKFNKWCREVAEQEGVAFLDFNDLAAGEYEKAGKTKAQAELFSDSVHTTEKGAKLNCELLIKGLRSIGSPLAQYAK